jgi:hypothetical protein
MRGLVSFLCPMEREDGGKDRIVFATLEEALAYVTDGPEDELDELDD